MAFIIYKRTDLTSRVFAEIKKAKPPILLVIADGPRKDFGEDNELVKRSRAVIDQVDWLCKVYKKFSDSKLGVTLLAIFPNSCITKYVFKMMTNQLSSSVTSKSACSLAVSYI